MLNIGDIAPDFSLANEDGVTTSLEELLKEGPLILYFYPADFTSVCTAEACEIRDIHEDLRGVNANVVGVSPQGEASHSKFRKRYNLPFPLLDDSDKKVIEAYGVNGPLGMGVRRVTFLINPDKEIANRVVADFTVKQHIGLMEQVIEDLGGY